MRWSYKTIHFGLKKDGLLGSSFLDDAEIEETLNEYGQGGWELVSMLETRDGVLAVFKQSLDFPSTRQAAPVHRDEQRRAVSSVAPAVAVKPQYEAADELDNEPELEADYRDEPNDDQEPVYDDEREEPEVGLVDDNDDEDDSDSGIGSIRIE
ncbi:DUF4177 domain-containing protein [Desulfopila aestuarii]|uniref:DUF4177 domain-containing protein n=1 Tax=Desulfopila aestuarii DSM 18488 TaxID=1121416 RepID=A0A1M7YD17_9BACT|nr:DUF4177 domain-containing protein [Desulfopila aestuarii]SHO50527.1 protein of unknown function [Desulfopila aestuarii DSM 18488]